MERQMDLKQHIRRVYSVRVSKKLHSFVQNKHYDRTVNEWWAHKHESTNYAELIRRLEGDGLTWTQTKTVIKMLYRELHRTHSKTPQHVVMQDCARCIKNMLQRIG